MLPNPATGSASVVVEGSVWFIWFLVLFFISAMFLAKNLNFLLNARSKRKCILNSLLYSRSAKAVHSLDCTHKGLASSEDFTQNLLNINLTN